MYHPDKAAADQKEIAKLLYDYIELHMMNWVEGSQNRQCSVSVQCCQTSVDMCSSHLMHMFGVVST